MGFSQGHLNRVTHPPPLPPPRVSDVVYDGYDGVGTCPATLARAPSWSSSRWRTMWSSSYCVGTSSYHQGIGLRAALPKHRLSLCVPRLGHYGRGIAGFPAIRRKSNIRELSRYQKAMPKPCGPTRTASASLGYPDALKHKLSRECTGAAPGKLR